MKKSTKIIIAVLLLAVVAFLFYRWKTAKAKPQANNGAPAQNDTVSDVSNGLEPDLVINNNTGSGPRPADIYPADNSSFVQDNSSFVIV
jgi:hypothetical protein